MSDALSYADRYPDMACSALKSDIRVFTQQGCSIQSEDVIPGNGASELFMAIAHALKPQKQCFWPRLFRLWACASCSRLWYRIFPVGWAEWFFSCCTAGCFNGYAYRWYRYIFYRKSKQSDRVSCRQHFHEANNRALQRKAYLCGGRWMLHGLLVKKIYSVYHFMWLWQSDCCKSLYQAFCYSGSKAWIYAQ